MEYIDIPKAAPKKIIIIIKATIYSPPSSTLSSVTTVTSTSNFLPNCIQVEGSPIYMSITEFDMPPRSVTTRRPIPSISSTVPNGYRLLAQEYPSCGQDPSAHLLLVHS